MRVKRSWALVLSSALILAACGGNGDDEEVAAPETEDAVEEEEEEEAEEEPDDEEEEEEAGVRPDVDVPEDRIELDFWHAMGGELGEATEAIVNGFNDSQDEIFVVPTFQGSYDDTYNSLLASFDADNQPNIVQNFDLGAQTMIDTGQIVPAHELMELDGYDPSVFLPAVADYYSDDTGGMAAMAFNSSTPILFYNKEMFEEAGVEAVDGDSWSFSEFLEACDALQEVVEFCHTFGTVGWYHEQITANSGGLYFDNDNGRTGRAENAVFNEGVSVEVFDFLTGLIANGQAPNLGNTWTETDTVFTERQSAMIFDSTAGTAGLVDTADFEVGTMYMPYADSAGARNGVIIGGGSLWLMDSGDEETNLAAWEFMKFVAEQETQAQWHKDTGYFSVRVEAEDDPDLISFWEESPNFRTAVEQLASTQTVIDGEVNYPVLGGRAGPFPAIRQLVVEAYGRVLDDGDSPQEALDNAAERATAELENYNEFFAE